MCIPAQVSRTTADSCSLAANPQAVTLRSYVPAPALRRKHIHNAQRFKDGSIQCSATGNGTAAAPSIDIVFTDVDGTLLNSQQILPDSVAATVNKATDAGVKVILATGKARGPWLRDVLPKLNISGPTIFLQGLLIYDEHGNELLSRQLEEEVAEHVLQLAAEHDMTVTAYCGDRILCDNTDQHTDRLLFYKEPTPEPVGPLQDMLGKVPVHKLILMAEHPRIEKLRPIAQELLGQRATLTTALPGMLEVLPLGASKAAGVSLVLQHLGMTADHMMAVGDGENDVEMLQMAAWGVAMGNAGAKLKGLAQHVTGTNDEGGLGQALEKFVLEPRGLVVGNTGQHNK